MSEHIIPKLTEKQVAEALNCTTRFLQNDRTREDCIPFYKIGDLVRYDWDEVVRHLQTKRPKRCRNSTETLEQLRDDTSAT